MLSVIRVAHQQMSGAATRKNLQLHILTFGTVYVIKSHSLISTIASLILCMNEN